MISTPHFSNIIYKTFYAFLLAIRMVSNEMFVCVCACVCDITNNQTANLHDLLQWYNGFDEIFICWLKKTKKWQHFNKNPR